MNAGYAMLVLKQFAFALLSPRRRFQRIYRLNRWHSQESVSGPGSSMTATSLLRKELPALLDRFGIKVLLDAPCGSFGWMEQVLADYPHLTEYIGADIVPDLVRSNAAKYSSTRVRFIEADLTNDTLPKADAVISRDCFIHFSYRDFGRAIQNLKRTGSSFLLTSTYLNIKENRDITTGRYRLINLALPPYNFPPPIISIPENEDVPENADKGKQLGVWAFHDLPG
jgi:hypothetical protein